MSNTYTYYGEADGLTHSALVNESIREAVNVTGEHGWEPQHIDYCHEEVWNAEARNQHTGKRGRWEPEAKIILRRKAD